MVLRLNPFSEPFPENFWGDRFQQGIWEGNRAVMPLYGTRAKLWLGPGAKAPGNSKELVL